MLGLIILPFYLLFNLFLNKTIMKWLNLFNNLKNKKCIKYILLVIQMFLTLSIYIAILLPNSNLKRLLTIIGNYYLGIMIYTGIILAILLLLKLIFRKNNISNNIYKIVGFI